MPEFRTTRSFNAPPRACPASGPSSRVLTQGGSAAATRPSTMLLDASVARFEPKVLSLTGQQTCVPRWGEVNFVNAGEETIILEGVSSEHGAFHPTTNRTRASAPTARRLHALTKAVEAGDPMHSGDT